MKTNIMPTTTIVTQHTVEALPAWRNQRQHDEPREKYAVAVREVLRRSSHAERLFRVLVAVLIPICSLLFPLNVAGQELDSIDSGHPQGSSFSFKNRLLQVQQYLDSAARKKVDSRYIEVPAKPWRVILRYKETAFDVDYSNVAGDPAAGDGAEWQLCFEPPSSASIGIWAGYRGTGFSFAKSLKKKAGTTLSFSTTGAKYGANLRLRGFEIDEAKLTSTIYEYGEVFHETDQGHTGAPVEIASLYLNGYYVFNGRRYSQAAAYNQSVIQRRSAGSLLAGATLYMSSFDFSDDRNVLMMLLSHNTGRIKLHQGNIGLGYGYNWVPLRGLVVNAMAMPTVSFYNRVKVYKYDSNYELNILEGTDDYGQWNAQTHTWANGKKYKPLPLDDEKKKWLDGADCWETGSETDYSMLRFNVDLRVGIAYNWKDYFIGLQAQFNNFNYKKGQCKVNLFDAYARMSLGVRL